MPDSNECDIVRIEWALFLHASAEVKMICLTKKKAIFGDCSKSDLFLVLD